MSPLSSQGLSRSVEGNESSLSSIDRSQVKCFDKVRAGSSVHGLWNEIELRPLSREQQIWKAVLLIFCDPLPEQCRQLMHLSRREWQSLFRWLDISGMALYFLDRTAELNFEVPSFVEERLRQNLSDNTQRTRGMIAESVAIQQEFQKVSLSYATLKGFSLPPDSVPRPELRHQFDLDFLVAEESASEARRTLERRGYRLTGMSGRSLEFKINETPNVSLDDLYTDTPGRSVELHLEASGGTHSSVLDRIEIRDFYGIKMPVLSPVDLFIGQGLHVYKDVCSEFSRTAHLLEFRRHVSARYDDDTFWSGLRAVAEVNVRASLGLGVVTELITQVMGEFAPVALTNWTTGRLSPSVRLWIDMYGRRAVFKKFPGNKLYLLLQEELESAGIPVKRSLRKALVPSRLPPLVVKKSAGESLSTRMLRYWVQVTFIFFRLRFHLVEGVRYTWERYRWRQHLNRL